MDYLVVRPTRQHGYAITGTIDLTDRLADDDLKRGAYVPLSDILGLDDPVVNGITCRDYLTKNLNLLIQESIPVLRYTAKEWRIFLPAAIVGQIRLAQFANQLEEFMLTYCSLSDRQKIILAAEEALYRLAEVVQMDAYAIKTTTWKYLQEEEDAGRCSLNGWETFRENAGQFLLRRLFPKFNQSEFSNPVILDDVRSVFNMILLARMLRQQKSLICRYEKDIATIQDLEALIDYYFPNPIKPR